MFKKKSLLLVLGLSLTATALAAPVGQDEALRKATAFMASRNQKQGQKRLKAARRQPGMTLASGAQDASYYVFNVGESDGFVIVSGDDSTVPVLGYVDHGNFDSQTIPDAMQAWLEDNGRQIRRLQASPETKPVAGWSQAAIAPLITTMWNQYSPYNNECPVLPDGKPAITGCVATTMAQIMCYHRWPAAVKTDIPAYEGVTTWGDAGKLTFPGVPAGTVFEWDKMKATYSADEPDEVVKPVAVLMKACGAAAKADYTNLNSGGTSARINDALYALYHYFDYSPTISYERRENYDYSEWLDLIYAELKAGRPVIYDGHSYESGHSFIVDGCDGSLFHVNWGWGGYCDGYFVLSVANPGSNEDSDSSNIRKNAISSRKRSSERLYDGLGPSDDGYSMNQGVIIGIKKNEGEQPANVRMFSAIVKVEGNEITASYGNDQCNSYLFDFGIGYAQADGSYTACKYYQAKDPLPNGHLYAEVSFPITELPEGTWKLVPISRLRDTDKWLPNLNVRQHYVLATSDGTAVTLEWKKPVVALEATAFSCTSKHKLGLQQDVSVSITNKGDEYYGPLYFYLGQGSTATLIRPVGVSVEAGATETIPFGFMPKASGENILLVATDGQLGNVIGRYVINIKSQGESGENLSVTAIRFNNDNAATRLIPAYEGTITVKNDGTEEFDGELLLRILYNSAGLEGNYVYLKDVDFNAIVPAGGSAEVPFSVKGLIPGNYYWPMFYVDKKLLWNQGNGADIRCFHPDADGISSLHTNDVVAPWYTPSGIPVQQPRRGVYIRNGRQVLVR
ncbi:MAG: C10 family peptidase [Bacteroidales bacterium]|nr:C10 family peptidase [Bacteroidales bacterium]